MSALVTIAPKLTKLIPLLDSDKDGEVVATARAIGRALKQAGADFHDLADAISFTAPAQRSPKQPQPPRTPTWAHVDNPQNFLGQIKTEPWLSAWESEFVTSIRAQLAGFMPREPSPKQRAVLDRLVRRAVEHGVQP